MSSLTTSHMTYHVTNRFGSTNRIFILVVLYSLRDVLSQDTSGTIQSCARDGCQNFVDEGEFQNCHCLHLSSDAPGCIDGCQSVKCTCHRRLGFNCTLWCQFSPDPYSPGCICTGLWNIGKSTPKRVTSLMPSSSIATTTTTEDDMLDHKMSDCGSQDNTPGAHYVSSVIIASVIGGMVAVAVVIVIVVFCGRTGRSAPCWTRRPTRTSLAQNHAPPTYEDTIKLLTIVVPGNGQPAVPPPYSEDVPPYTPFEIKNESSI